MQIATNTSFTGNFLYQIGQLESRQSTLQNEVTTGLKVTNPEDNPAVMDQVLNLQAEAGADTQYQNNISQLQITATTASDALSSLHTLVEQAGQIATQAGGISSSSQLGTYAAQIGQLIQQALQLANTQDAQGNYIFAGTNTGSPAFSATTDSSGNVTAVTYSGNTSVTKTEIAPGLTVAAHIPGENNSGSGTGGVFADSRAGADLFNHLIALQQDLSSGNTAATTTDSANLTKDEDNVVTQISGNAVLQSALQSANTMATQKSTSIDTQISNATNADLALTMTQLDQTQTAYQAALESGVKVMNLSLLDYLH